MRSRHEITKFLDYRAFLLAHVQEARAKNSRWTFGMWARLLGVKGTASITRVIQGEREPGKLLTERLVCYFDFHPDEAQYFQDLIQLHKVRNDAKLSVALLEKIGKRHPNCALRVLDEASFATISNWYSFVIREMVRLKDFEASPEVIAAKLLFPISEREVAVAIENLLKVGLLRRDGEGKLHVSEGRVHTIDDYANEAVKRYHEQMLENAKASLRLIPVERRDVSAITLSMPRHAISKAKELIREFQDKFSQLLEQEESDAVYQLQVQLFPLTLEEVI